MEGFSQKQCDLIMNLVTKSVEKALIKFSHTLERKIEETVEACLTNSQNNILYNMNDGLSSLHSLRISQKKKKASGSASQSDGAFVKGVTNNKINRPKFGEVYVDKYTQEDQDWVVSPLNTQQMANILSEPFAHEIADRKFKLPKEWDGNIVGAAFIKDIWYLVVSVYPYCSV